MEDKQLVEGEIADYLLTDDGILISYSKSVLRTVENIKANVTLVKKITDNKKVPLLIYLKNSPVPDRETQRFQLNSCLKFIKPWPWFRNLVWLN